MQARSQRRPFDSADHIFEPKWDGIRAVVFVEDTGLRIQTRNLNDVTGRFPELASLPKSLAADGVVLDGEIVCLDEEGRPSFSRIQQRFQRTPPYDESNSGATFVGFDILYVNSDSVMDTPPTDPPPLSPMTGRAYPPPQARACAHAPSAGKEPNPVPVSAGEYWNRHDRRHHDARTEAAGAERVPDVPVLAVDVNGEQIELVRPHSL